jgi:hypothetical protein
MRVFAVVTRAFAFASVPAAALGLWAGCGSSSSGNNEQHPPVDSGMSAMDSGAPMQGEEAGPIIPDDASACIGTDAGAMIVNSDGKMVNYTYAPGDVATGDWEGTGGLVAQVFQTSAGAWAANVLTAFDQPNPMPVATLSGTPMGCASMNFTGTGGWTATLANGEFKGQGGGMSFDLHHVVRESPTLGAAPPSGAVVLFDGTDATYQAQWASITAGAWLMPGAAPGWPIVNGALQVKPGTVSIVTKQQFGPCKIHVEFRTLGTPTHSGVFPEARYQTTILQTYGSLTGNITGNFGNESPVANPQIHAERAPLEWQTFDIDFHPPMTGDAGAQPLDTVQLNGVTVFTNFQLNATTGAAPKGFAAMGPLLLEYHGMPLEYRNVWVLPEQ